jgi:hypothetical protein
LQALPACQGLSLPRHGGVSTPLQDRDLLPRAAAVSELNPRCLLLRVAEPSQRVGQQPM